MASPILVTGGTGRLGRLVAARLVDSGCDVRVLARHDRPVPPTCGPVRASTQR